MTCTRRTLLTLGGAATVAAAFPGLDLVAQSSFDVVLHGGTLVDGTGGPLFQADLGIVGDRIEAIGRIAPERGRRAISCAGLHVSPGFIDIHSHSDGDILLYRTADSRVRQGVTTELTGNCGSSAAPLAGVGADADRKDWKDAGVPEEWAGVGSYCDLLDKAKLSVNQALLLGQGTLRSNAIGVVDRPLTADELKAVLRAVEEGLDEGAYGLSTGLEYTPGRYTPTDEIVAMSRIVARYGALYTSHVRNEEATLLEAVNEALNIGRLSGARVQVSHLKAAGQPNWNKQQGALDLIASARRDGLMVLADAYPYTAYSTGLSILLSDAALDGGFTKTMERLRDRTWRERIRREVEAQMAEELGDYALIVIASVRSQKNQAIIGKNMAEIARGWDLVPVDAVLRLLEEEEGSVSIIGHGMSPDNVEKVLRHPLVMVSSDGRSMSPTGRAASTRPHPRSYGAFARVLGYYTRERKLFDLPEAVKKMTSMPADQIGLRDRGRIARGLKADLVAFDAATVKDEATFDTPHRYASGIPHVLVNGVPVVEGGKHTAATPGRALRRA